MEFRREQRQLQTAPRESANTEHSTSGFRGGFPLPLLALVRPAFDLVLRRIQSLKRCVQACGCKIMTPRYAVLQNARKTDALKQSPAWLLAGLAWLLAGFLAGLVWLPGWFGLAPGWFGLAPGWLSGWFGLASFFFPVFLARLLLAFCKHI